MPNYTRQQDFKYVMYLMYKRKLRFVSNVSLMQLKYVSLIIHK